MPFTLAHPAIILPLLKSKRFSATALLAGAMVPDFEFFLQMREVENIGHHWYGVLLFDLPVALLFCYLYHNLLKHYLITNLPAMFRIKYMGLRSFNWNSYVLRNPFKVVMSLLLGIASHIFLDAFTHYNGAFVLLMPILSTTVAIGKLQLPVYFLLQLLLSVVGMAIVYMAIHKMPATATKATIGKSSMHYWTLGCIVCAIIFGGRVFFWPQYNSFWGLVMAFMGSLLYTWILISFTFRQIQFKK